MPGKGLTAIRESTCPFYFYDFSAVYPIFCFLDIDSMRAVYLCFVQFVHDLSSNYSVSQVPGVKGGACWKFEVQINVHWRAKPVRSHCHVNLLAEEGQCCTEGRECSGERIKAFPVMEIWIQASLDTFASGIPLSLQKPVSCDPYKGFCKAPFCKDHFAVYLVFVVERYLWRHSCLVHQKCSNCMNP